MSMVILTLTDKDYKKLKPHEALCYICGHNQEAKKGFACGKCGEETFTKNEWFGLLYACKSAKFVPLKRKTEKEQRA